MNFNGIAFIHLLNIPELCRDFLKSLGENMFVKSVSFLPATIKSINPMPKYPHVIELFACI